MCAICKRVKATTHTPAQRLKEIKKIYAEMIREEKRWNPGPLSEDEKRMYMEDAEYEYQQEQREAGGYYNEDAGFGVLTSVECCGVREMRSIQAECEKGFNLLVSEVSKTGRFGFLFATTTQAQTRAAAALDARGFTQAGVFNNPNTSNTVTFWTYNITPVKAKEKKSGKEKRNARLAA